MKAYKIIQLAVILLICQSITGCKKFIEIDEPTTQLTAIKVFENEGTATAALSDIYYKSINGNFADGGLYSVTLLGGMSSDELENFSESNDFIQISTNQIIASNGSVANIWTSAYQMVYECNAILEGLEQSKSISQIAKQQLSGEALFLRSFAHLYLCSLYDNVPIVKSTDYRKNTAIKQSSKTEVLQAITEDLMQAIPMLNSDYAQWKDERIRVNKWAAKALLARAYLYQGDYQNAETQASKVIENTVLFSIISPNEVFIKNSKEAIWQLKPQGITYNTKEGNQFILTARPTICALRSTFPNSFESNDQRAVKWIGKYTSGIESWYYPNKYKIMQGTTTINEYSMVLRLAEQYLIRAEARAMQDKYSLAIQDINLLRLKHGALTNPLPDPTDRNTTLNIILHERQVELFSEWGHRWIDLNRFGKANEILSTVKPGWQSTAIFFPIPQSELVVNKSLIQNPGYH